MKSVLKEFCELFGYCVLVVCFLFASYLLLINFYHYKELNKTVDRNFASENLYSSVKTTIEEAKENVKSVNASGNSNKESGASLIKTGFDTCITALENSNFYKLSEKNSFSEKDIYDTNKEMYNTINNKCLFYIPYYIEGANKTYNVGSSYEKELKSDILFVKDKVGSYSDYLYTKSLGNSSYKYSTSISTSTIYNDLEKNINLTIYNYRELANAVLELSSWYVDEFGGVR